MVTWENCRNEFERALLAGSVMEKTVLESSQVKSHQPHFSSVVGLRNGESSFTSLVFTARIHARLRPSAWTAHTVATWRRWLFVRAEWLLTLRRTYWRLPRARGKRYRRTCVCEDSEPTWKLKGHNFGNKGWSVRLGAPLHEILIRVQQCSSLLTGRVK